MASKALSPFPRSNIAEQSVYETLLQHDESSDQSDVEERGGLTVDEENLGVGLEDLLLDDAVDEGDASQPIFSQLDRKRRIRQTTSLPSAEEPDRGSNVIERPYTDDADGDVPQSLLLENELHQLPPRPSEEPFPHRQASQTEQSGPEVPVIPRSIPRSLKGGVISSKERALWRWANVENLDTFLRDVYDYFMGNGIYSIMLSKVLNLLTLAFVVGFSTFLTSCVDFPKIPTSKKMEQVIIKRCTKDMSTSKSILIWLFSLFWIWKFFQLLFDLRRLRHMQQFFEHLLDLSDAEIQTVSWQEIVKRLMLLRDSNAATAGQRESHRRFVGNQSKQRMDAHDIANRLMRRDNYMIALINKDTLDLTLPIPFLKNRQIFSKTIEWSLSQCILDYVFNQHGQVRPLFLKDSHRRALSDGLKRRFQFAGIMNIVCAPFILIYFFMLYFFRYFNEYQKNPSKIGSRQYTPYAEWKFREFNELWHLYQRRSNMSYPFAARYIDQFPKDKTVQMAGFVAFIAGALASILALASVIDPNLFLEFEITPERTVLFYLGIFGTIWAIARGTVPEENLVFDPEYALRNVIEYTHYCPKHWQGRLHSDEVKSEFATLYRMKIVIFLEEMMSIILTPLILWFTLPQCSDKIIDFFREFTVHVDGLGYVCSFAVFDFRKDPTGASEPKRKVDDLREGYYSTKDGKMLASYYGFIDNYVTNQKPNAPYLHPQDRQNFHLPPSFPGLASPTMQTQHPLSRNARRQPDIRQSHRSQRAGHSVYDLANQPSSRIPRSKMAGVTSSTMASVLLDPHHHPTQSILKTVSKSASQSKIQRSHKLAFNTPAEDEDPHDTRYEESEDTGEDSHLGESWKTTQAGTVDEDDKGDGPALDNSREPGVLGLVYQFSKAQTEGRGANVRI